MRLLCVQCLKVNEVGDNTAPDSAGKVRVECPACGFVTVITRRTAGASAKPRTAEPLHRPSTPPPQAPPLASEVPTAETPMPGLGDQLFDGVDEVGDWMVRHLDGTEVGPMEFDRIREMITTGKLGKIDEVRKLDERYVPAAFHEATAELFNELETTGI